MPKSRVKRIHCNAICQCDTKLCGRIFVKPGGNAARWLVAGVRTDLLMRTEPFVRLSAHRRQRQATRGS